MNPEDPQVVTRTVHTEAIVLRIRVPLLREGEQRLGAVRDALYREAESADRPLVLDLSAVEFLTSAALGWLITLRRRLIDRGGRFAPPCRRGLYAQFPDVDAALEAIRRGESDPLMLCGAGPGVREIFVVC